MKKKEKTKKSKKPDRNPKSSGKEVLVKKEIITAHRFPEGEFGGREANFTSILENIETFYFELDLEGNLTFFNDTACRDLGYSREELLGMNYRAYSKPENIDIIKNIYKELYRT